MSQFQVLATILISQYYSPHQTLTKTEPIPDTSISRKPSKQNVEIVVKNLLMSAI